MVFSSLSFVYIFFPLVFIAYFIIRNRTWRNLVLLLSSLFFYSWGEPKFVLQMVAASLVAYLGGRLMDSFRGQGREKSEKTAYIVTVILLVANLFVFKYLNFVGDNVCALLGISRKFADIVLPIGISFYTFQILSYVIDLHRNKITVQKNPFDLMLYVCLFPQLIAGPIVRYQTVEDEIRNRRENLDDVYEGVKRFILGLSKKVLLANNIALLAEAVYGGDAAIYGAGMYWLAALAYTMQIYFDFSGYSDMAIGLGRIFGFHFLENFDYPYVSRSITEFWRRWHISLSSWFRDYIYIPLGGNRVSPARQAFNIMVVWMLTGFWHGAEWNFVLWGLYYGLLLLLEKYVLKNLLDKLPGFLRWIYTMFFVVIGWVIFYFTDFAQLAQAFRTLFSFSGASWQEIVAADFSILNSLVYLPLCILFSFPVIRKLPKKDGLVWHVLSCGIYFALALICIIYIISSQYNPFIYFRF